MWVKFSDKKPQEGEYKEGEYLITRFPGFGGIGNSFEKWRIWSKEHLNVSYPEGTGRISHWWDGPSDLDLATEAWYMQ